MGRGQDQWSKQGAGHCSGLRSGSCSYKGSGKARGHRGGKRKDQQSWETAQFPAFEMMQPAAKQASSLVPTGRRSDLDRGCGERSYRVRHGRAEDLERLSQDGKQGKKIGGRKGRPGVKVAGVPERPAKGFPGRQEQVHGQDGQTEPGRRQQPEEQEEAIMELQLILSKPKEMLKRKESEEDQVALEELEKLLTQPETPQGSGLASLVASAVKKNELNNEDKTLEEHRRQSQVPSTPTGRGTKPVAMTPPAPASSWGPRRRRRRRDTTTTKARSRSATPT